MKTININRLKCALSTIHKENKKIFLSGKFFELLRKVHVKAVTNHKFRELLNILIFIWEYFENIEDNILKLYQHKKQYNQKKLDKDSWINFASKHIKDFYVDYRSLFDFLAKAIRLASDPPKQSSTSFNKLLKWIKNPNNVMKLGEDLSNVVRSCDWFKDLREVRDSILHEDARILIFLDKDKILFQIYDKNWERKMILKPEIIMNNENVADFELYAGLYIGYLIAYLEEVSEVIISRLNLSIKKLTSKSCHGGLHIIYKWIEKVLHKLDKS
ncbi:hypothetical protein ES702_02285 [subsurface metagenome]